MSDNGWDLLLIHSANRSRNGCSSRSFTIPALWRATATLHWYRSAKAGRQRRIGVDCDMKVFSSLAAMPSCSGYRADGNLWTRSQTRCFA